MRSPIKLLFIIDYFKNPYAGTEGQLFKLIDKLDKDRFAPVFVVFRSSAYLDNNDFPVPVDVLNIKRLSSPFSLLKLFRYFLKKKSENYKLAHIYFNDASIVCPPLLKLLGYKALISRRDMGYWYNSLNLTALKLNALIVDRVIANSYAVKKMTMCKEGYKSEKVGVIYNGYQESLLPSVNNYLTKTNEVDFNDSEIGIVLVANIRPIKRIADAIYALKIVIDSNASGLLYILGDGEQAPLVELAEHLGITSSVRFIGPRDDVLQLLPRFHIGVLCSESEGFSNTLIEYMQSSLPVVCSNVGGNPEIVEHGFNGYLYDVGDVQSLAKYLLKLVVDSQLRNCLGQAGMKKVESDYGLTKCVAQHQRLYEELVN